MAPARNDLITISTDDLALVSGGAVLVGGYCVAMCPTKRLPNQPAVTADEIWDDQQKQKR